MPKNPNPAGQGDHCNEHDECDEESVFDYEKVLSNVLNEKKLALLNTPDVIKFIQQTQQQQQRQQQQHKI